MCIDEKNFLYYVSKSGANCRIMEINPRQSNMRNHICIFELKADKCLGFRVSQNGKQFIFINQSKSAYVLERILDSRKLKLVCEKNMNETF